MPEIQIRGTDLFYTERGTGEPVVFVHGAPADYRTWAAQLDGIGKGYRAIAYSRRWSWPNEPFVTGTNDMATHIDDLADLILALGAAPAHLVGNSWGAFAALVLARRRPELVRSLVLEEPPIVPVVIGQPPAPSRMIATLIRRPALFTGLLRFRTGTLAPAERLIAEGRVPEAVDRFIRGALTPAAVDAMPPARRQQFDANAGEWASSFPTAGHFEPFSEADVRAVAAPTLVMSGERSPRVLPRLAALLASLLPNAMAVEIADASHLMHEDQPSATNAAILGFLGGLEHRAAA